MFDLVRQLHEVHPESLYVCSKEESLNVCSTQTFKMERKSEVCSTMSSLLLLTYLQSCQSPGPYDPAKDTYYEADPLPKEPFTKVKVQKR